MKKDAKGCVVVLASFLVCAFHARPAEARGPSTVEERARFVTLVRSLETDPLRENADVTRQQLREWAMEVPDIRFQVCAELLGDVLRDEGSYSRELEQQVFLSGAAFTIDDPGKARKDVAVYLAGVEGALRAYEVLLRSRPDVRTAGLDDLLEKQRTGELADHIALLAEGRCKKSNERLIAAPIGAAVGLLLALLVARGFGRPTGRPVPARVAAIAPGVVFVCAGYYLTAIVLLHFLEPEYDPRYFPVSHYVWGTYGWIMTTTFFALALALFTVAVGLRNTRTSSRTARIGFGLLVVGALFICLAGVFKGFPLHDVASAVGLPSVALAVLVLSWASRSLAGCVLALAMFAALLSMMLDVGMPGLQQRAFLFLLLVWLSAAALVRPPVGLEHGDAR